MTEDRPPVTVGSDVIIVGCPSMRHDGARGTLTALDADGSWYRVRIDASAAYCEPASVRAP